MPIVSNDLTVYDNLLQEESNGMAGIRDFVHKTDVQGMHVLDILYLLVKTSMGECERSIRLGLFTRYFQVLDHWMPNKQRGFPIRSTGVKGRLNC